MSTFRTPLDNYSTKDTNGFSPEFSSRYVPVNPYTKLPANLSDKQKLALDDDYIRKNPQLAAVQRYYNPFHGSGNPNYANGMWLREKLQQPNFVGSILNQGPVIGALALGAAGLIGGGLVGKALDMFKGDEGRAKRLAILGGLSGAGLGGVSGYFRTREKRASFFGAGTDRRDILIQLISSLPLSYEQRRQATSAIYRLSEYEAQQLSNQVRFMGGAAAGALIMKYLFGSGPLGMILGGLAGGFIAKGDISPYKKGPMGIRSYAGYDRDGRKLNFF